MTPQKRKSTLIISLAAAALLSAAFYLAVRKASPDQTGTINPGNHAAARADSSQSAPRPPHPREQARPPRSENAPSLSASDAVASLVGNAMSDPEVVSGLREIIRDSSRPIDERVEALGHVINLVPDAQPGPLLEIAEQDVKSGEIARVILHESLNRPTTLRAELLLRLLENTSADLHEEILEELQTVVDYDVGKDPAEWRKAIDAMSEEP